MASELGLHCFFRRRRLISVLTICSGLSVLILRVYMLVGDFFIYFIYVIVVGESLALWVNFSADDILKYFLILTRKQDLTLHANFLH